MRTYKFVAAVLFFIAMTAMSEAANWYIAKSATGSGNGTSWTNAWTDFNEINWSSVSCGDTIWVAGNNGGAAYTGNLTPTNKVCTSSTVININRVLSTDAVPVAAPGWQSTFDSQVVINNASVSMNGQYIWINGRVGDAQSSVPYGIQFNNTTDGWTGVFADPSSGTILFNASYVEVHGPACVTSGTCNNSNWALAVQNGSKFNVTFDHTWLHQFGEVIHGPYGSGTALTVTNSYIGEDVKVNKAEHEDWLYTSNPCGSMTFINDRWYSSGNDGIFMDNGGCSAGFTMINNLFFHWGGWAIEFGKTGTCGPYVLLNNSFINDSLGSDGNGNEYPYGWIESGGCTFASGTIFENNILYNTALSNFTNAEATYNAGTTANGNSFSCGTGCFSYSLASPISSFNGVVDLVPAGANSETVVTADLHLSTAGGTLFSGKCENLATSEGSTYPQLLTDLDGNPRPGASQGAWTCGAYQYQGTGTAPASPVTPDAAVH